MGYLRRLRTLDVDGTLIREADARALLLTGQSSFASSALSPDQTSFLRGVTWPRYEPILAGFPFHREFAAHDYRCPTLIAASARNALQTIWTRWNRRYLETVSRRLQQAIDATRESLLIITGSCGLQMANAAWRRLRIPEGLDVRVVALGPVNFGRLQVSRASLTVVQGMQDWWSRMMYRGPVDYPVACGHLEYWTSTAVRERVRSILAGW